jgi:CYTH domain-containing protein
VVGAVPKYARPERERRFVLDAMPPGAAAGHRIVDRYVRGTHLRLREVGDGDDAVLKLGHKVRPDEADPRLVLHTTIYLTRPEFDLLAALPADTVTKHRAWVVAPGGGRIAVDSFEGALAGLILAEVELADTDTPFEPPSWGLAEVSTDERFTGGRLAASTRGELREALADVLGAAAARRMLGR